MWWRSASTACAWSDGGRLTTLSEVPYATSEAQQQLLDTLAEATDELGYALACLAEA